MIGRVVLCYNSSKIILIMKQFLWRLFLLLVLFFSAVLPFGAFAYQTEVLAGVKVSGDYTLSPAQSEVGLDAGDSASREIVVLNRSGSDLSFTVSVEDFIDSHSFKNYLQPEISTFSLRQGEQITLPITINIPKNTAPDGLFGVVVVSAQAPNQVPIRLSSLFFVRINGEVSASGILEGFKSDRWFYWSGPIKFSSSFKNFGNLYLFPSGELTVSDIYGNKVYRKIVSPYFVLPQTIKEQNEVLDQKPLFGLYRATLRLNRGYGDYLDQQSVYFLVLPPNYLILALIILLVIFIIRWRSRLASQKNKFRYRPNPKS